VANLVGVASGDGAVVRLHARRASFDRLRMRGSFGGTKSGPHAEPVEARTALIQSLIEKRPS
jgi:hypothetical protein